MTERQLHRVFDFQRFAGNKRLQAVIDAAHERCETRELDEDELEFVSAAGVPEPPERGHPEDGNA